MDNGRETNTVTEAEVNEEAWNTSISGRIYQALQEIGQREGKVVEVIDKMSPTEVFKMGDQTVRLVRRLEGGETFSDTGTLTNWVESYEYKRTPWWKEVLDKQGVEFKFIDPPLANVAKDAAVSEAEDLFAFNQAAQKSGLSIDSGLDKIRARQKIQGALEAVLEPGLMPNYDIDYNEGAFRMRAKTDEAKASLTQDNPTYLQAVGIIKESVPKLQKAYQNLGTKTPLR